MPTVLRVEGFRLYFWSHEPDEPPHVHVDRAGCSTKVWLQPVALASSVGYAPRELGPVLRPVREHRERCLEAWHEYFDMGG